MNEKKTLPPNNDAMLDLDMQGLTEDIQLPEDFQHNWREAIRKEAESKPANRRFPWQRVAGIAAAFVFMIGGTLIAKQSGMLDTAPAATKLVETADYAGNSLMMSREVNAPEMSATAAGAEMYTDGQKLVYTASIDMSSVRFDDDLSAIRNMAQQAGGYIEYINQYGEAGSDSRSAYLTLWVPAEQMSAFVEQVSALGRVTGQTMTTDNITDSYTDVEARLSTQYQKRDRLNELMGTAAELTDLIALESELSNTQYEIERLERQKAGMDQQVSYSQVSVSLTEETPSSIAQAGTTLGERIKSGWSASLTALGAFFRDAAVFTVMISPVLVPLLAILVIVLIIRKKQKNK